MHRLAALSTRKCTLETYRSIPPSYKIAEGPSLANHPKLQDGSEATMWVSQGWPHRRMSPIFRSEKCPCSSRGSNLGLISNLMPVYRLPTLHDIGRHGRCQTDINGNYSIYIARHDVLTVSNQASCCTHVIKRAVMTLLKIQLQS